MPYERLARLPQYAIERRTTPMIGGRAEMSSKKDPEQLALQVNVGRRLRALREVVDASQPKWARDFGIPRQTWVNYESGQREIPMKLLDEITKVLGITTDFLIKGDLYALPPPWARILRENYPELAAQQPEPRISAIRAALWGYRHIDIKIDGQRRRNRSRST